MKGNKIIKRKLKPTSFLKKVNKVKRNAAKMKKKKTWPELEFEKVLNELSIAFESQRIVGTKIYDYYIPENNMIVEVQGDYWHANPMFFENLNKIQIRNKKNDEFKKIQVLGLGYLYKEVWENDLKNNRKNIVDEFKLIFNR